MFFSILFASLDGIVKRYTAEEIVEGSKLVLAVNRVRNCRGLKKKNCNDFVLFFVCSFSIIFLPILCVYVFVCGCICCIFLNPCLVYLKFRTFQEKQRNL